MWLNRHIQELGSTGDGLGTSEVHEEKSLLGARIYIL